MMIGVEGLEYSVFEWAGIVLMYAVLLGLVLLALLFLTAIILPFVVLAFKIGYIALWFGSWYFLIRYFSDCIKDVQQYGFHSVVWIFVGIILSPVLYFLVKYLLTYLLYFIATLYSKKQKRDKQISELD